MPTRMLPRSSRFRVTLVTLLSAFFLISCGSSGTHSTICPLGSAGSATCTCGESAAQACPAQIDQTLYTSSGSGEVSAFTIGTYTGTLSGPVSTATGSASVGMATVNANEFLFVSDPSHSQLDGFSIGAGGTLSTIAGSPFPVGQSSSPQGLASPSNGQQLLYAADNGGVDAFSIGANGVPTPIAGSPFASGTNRYLTTAYYGGFLYTSIDDPPGGIFGFTIGSTGALTEIPGSPFPITGQTVANSEPADIVASETYVYAALTGSNQIAAFAIDTSTGVLTPVAGSPYAAGTAPTALILANSFLYVINSADGTISGYSVDSSTGVLTKLVNSPFAIAGNALSTDFFGLHLYVPGSSGI
jgi:6-phosphogluconolactonase